MCLSPLSSLDISLLENATPPVAMLPTMLPATTLWERLRQRERKARPLTFVYITYASACLSGLGGVIWMYGEQFASQPLVHVVEILYLVSSIIWICTFLIYWRCGAPSAFSAWNQAWFGILCIALVVLCAYFIGLKSVVPLFAPMIQGSVGVVQLIFIIFGNYTTASEPSESS